MTRFPRLAARAVALATMLLWLMSGANAYAAGAPARAQVLGVDAFWLTVSSLDRSLLFYHDVLGLALIPATPASSRLAILQGLTATPGSRIRTETLSAGAGTPLRLLEFSNARHRVLHPHAVDPGAALLQVQVRDLDTVLTAAARAHVSIVTRGGAPLRLADGTRSIVLTDPDGFFVAVSEPPPGAPDSAPAATTLTVRYTVAAPATLVRFYRQTLGITLANGNFGDMGPWAVLLNARGAQQAVTAGRGLGGVQFLAFRRVPRHTYSGRPQDPGTPELSLRVANLRVALNAVRAAGVRVLSAGGQPVVLPDGGAAVLFRDPAGLLINLVQP